MRDIFFLDSILSTKIITIAYWIGLIAVLFLGMVFIMLGINSEQEANFAGHHLSSALSIVFGILIIVFGGIFVRLWAEFMVVMFKIQQNTRDTVAYLSAMYEQGR